MKRRSFIILMGAVFAALMALVLFVDGLPTVFSSVMAFPFEQVGAALRALALTGNIGNGFALALCIALSFLPILSVLRHRYEKDYLGENIVLCCNALENRINDYCCIRHKFVIERTRCNKRNCCCWIDNGGNSFVVFLPCQKTAIQI